LTNKTKRNTRNVGNSRKNKAPAKKNTKNYKHKQPSVKTMAVPLNLGYQTRQQNTESIQRIKGSEILQPITFSTTSSTGAFIEIPMNPLLLVGTRISQLAQNFQKYRFRSLLLRVAVNTSTTTTGSGVLGFMENPDQTIVPSVALNQIYACPGATQFPWWQQGMVAARIGDRNKWYNIDENSSEIMLTTQGKFVVGVVQPPSATLVVPMLLEYDIEFLGAAIQVQEVGQSSYTFLACAFTSIVTGTTRVQFNSSVVQPAASGPTAEYYIFAEPISLTGTDGEGTPFLIRPQAIEYSPTGVINTYSFYNSISDMIAGKAIDVYNANPGPLTLAANVTGYLWQGN